MHKIEFSKLLIGLDYLLFVVLMVCCMIFPNVDLTAVTIAWITQLGISTGFYYWKSRLENKIKVPMFVLRSMPKEFRTEMDLTQIVIAIIQNE